MPEGRQGPEGALGLVAAALASLEPSRERIDNLNVYPVPDGETGANMPLTVRAVHDALAGSSGATAREVAREVTRAVLMGARGNSGVILSQLVRGAAEVLAGDGEVDAVLLGRALRAASDAGYAAVREPQEGTILTVARALAERAEELASRPHPLGDVLAAVVTHGEEALARTPEELPMLREAGVVDAGGAGLVEIVRGVTAAVTGQPIAAAAPTDDDFPVEAIHQELSRFRYCAVFLIEGENLEQDAVERQLESLGDSLLVVGDTTALKVHVHTDDPGSALQVGTAVGVVERVEIANMHKQTEEREQRLLESAPDAQTDVVAVVVGEGNKRLFESLGVTKIVEGGQTMNPSTADLVAAIESTLAPEVIVLPNNSNVVMSAEQAASLAGKPTRVVPTTSMQAGLSTLIEFDANGSAEDNATQMAEALANVITGEVTVASRDAQLNGVAVAEGQYLGLAEGEAVAVGETFDEVARQVVERLLAEPRGVLTLLRGDDAPDLGDLLAVIAEHHPDVELDVQDGGQPHYPLLLAAE